MPSSTDTSPPYDISVAARLTGLTAANLRMWEKRYGVVEPERTESGRRVYSEEDLRRLTLLKNLTDRGQAIRKTCSLSIDELEQLLLNTRSDQQAGVSEKQDPPGAASSCRLVAVGEYLCKALRVGESGLKGTTTIAEFADLDSVDTDQLDEPADLLLVECPALFPDMISEIESLLDETKAVRAIVIYYFSRGQTVKTLQEGHGRLTAIRAPITPDELRLACAADIALANRTAIKALEGAPEGRTVSDEIPPRQFSDPQLAEISQISSSIECECPHHLASLLSSLVSFEQYSANCENRNEADAKMHAYLHKMSAHARATMEDALKVLVQFEGIELEQAD